MAYIRAFALFLIALAATNLSAHAAQPFELKAFEQAQAAGKSVLVDVRASWCPTCRQQKPIVEGLERENPNLAVYEIDFDTAKDLLQKFRVRYQSTLIMFKGDKEVGRSTGDADPARMRALVELGT
jgi:thiol-disulfide isomerase/thioredoxin